MARSLRTMRRGSGCTIYISLGVGNRVVVVKSRASGDIRIQYGGTRPDITDSNRFTPLKALTLSS
ncbi:MAG TPA: hypothetical protein VEG61_08625 [Candidatus Dormibacteraeota bacterium]|nr:hypothetical protein [Candidatus Dormibacteraeota bacterium]